MEQRTLNGITAPNARYFCGYDNAGKHICYWDRHGMKRKDEHEDCTDMDDVEFFKYLAKEGQITQTETGAGEL